MFCFFFFVYYVTLSFHFLVNSIYQNPIASLFSYFLSHPLESHIEKFASIFLLWLLIFSLCYICIYLIDRFFFRQNRNSYF